MMNKAQIRERLPDLQVFLQTVHTITSVLIVIIVAGYGLALWFWWQTQLSVSFLSATLSFLLYYVMRHYSVTIARYSLRYRLPTPQALATLDFINEQKKYKTDDEIIHQLIKILPIVQAQVETEVKQTQQNPAPSTFNDKDG
ncbi:MAG: hypothetical protein ACWA5U_04340 [bacterium]